MGAARTDTLAHRAGISAGWAALQSAGKHGIDLLVFLLLARLIAPEAFGLVAMASALIVLITVAAEFGLGEALVQRQDFRAEHADAAFWGALVVAALIIAALLALAPLAAQAYGRADLTPILRALAPLLLLNALNLVPQAMLQRELRFKTLALRAMVGSLAGGGLGVTLAFQGAGPWALVAQQLASATIGLAGLWRLCGWRPQRRFSRRHAGQLIAFSRSVVGARLLNVAASKADDILVGLFLGPIALGFYSIACRLLLALEQLFCHGVDAVALSALSRAAGARARMRRLFLAATRLAALLAFPVFSLAILLAPQLIAGTLGAAWLPSAQLLQVLLAAGLLHSLMHFNHTVFKAGGRPELSLRIAAGSAGLNLVTLTVAVHFGVLAVAVSCLLRTALIAPLGLWLACRVLRLPLRRYLAQLRRPAVGLLLLVAAVVGLRDALPAQWPAAVQGLALAAVGAAAYMGWLAYTARRRGLRQTRFAAAHAVTPGVPQ